MYIARGATSKLPGYVSPSDQKFSYYYPGGNLYYGEDHQILTCKIPGAYLWRPFVLNCYGKLYHKEVFVGDTNRFFIAQFHGPINFKYTEDIPKVANFKDPILGFLAYKGNPFSGRSMKAFAFCKGKSYDITRIYKSPHFYIAQKVSYLSVHTVSQLSHIVYPEMKWVLVTALRTRLPEDAVCLSRGKFYISWSSNASENNAIPFYNVSMSSLYKLYPPGYTRQWDIVHERYEILLFAHDPDTFEFNCFIEIDVLHNRDSRGSSMSLSIEEYITDYCKEVGRRSYYNVLVEKTSGKAYILMKICSPYTLQELCRNVILASTLGIPNWIDCLPLPITMKEYCKRAIS